jgi:glycosyltransferase involved in cell wall biosynthesis
MKISVVISTYNAAAFIQATLDAVLRQTVLPDEFFVLDDGSSDGTLSLLRSYGNRITVLQQENQGVAPSRNTLSKMATGDLVAFVDHDDLWHPHYLEVQRRLFEEYPEAVAFFTGHVNFNGFDLPQWPANPLPDRVERELIEPINFLTRYNQTTGDFGSMSFCCVPKRVLTEMGQEPFRVSGVDDSYLCTVLPLLGPVVYSPAPLVAYRLSIGSLSENRLKSLGLWVKVFELLDQRYRGQDDARLRGAFLLAFALKRRRYGKLLMGAGKTQEARSQFLKAVKSACAPASALKSLVLFALTLLPTALQPAWPSGDRASGDKMMNFNRKRGAQSLRP